MHILRKQELWRETIPTARKLSVCRIHYLLLSMKTNIKNCLSINQCHWTCHRVRTLPKRITKAVVRYRWYCQSFTGENLHEFHYTLSVNIKLYIANNTWWLIVCVAELVNPDTHNLRFLKKHQLVFSKDICSIDCFQNIRQYSDNERSSNDSCINFTSLFSEEKHIFWSFREYCFANRSSTLSRGIT